MTKKLNTRKVAGPWKVGDKVQVILTGKTGEIVKAPWSAHDQHHFYVTVAWDVPVFGVTTGKVSPNNLVTQVRPAAPLPEPTKGARA